MRLGLRVKATLSVLLIVTLVLLLTATGGLIQLRAQVNDEQQRSADSMARSLAEASELALAVGDRNELGRLAERFLWDEHVLFVAVYDRAGALAARAVHDEKAWDAYRTVDTRADRFFLGTRFVSVSGFDSPLDDFELESPELSAIQNFGGDPGDENIDPMATIGHVIVGRSTAPMQAAMSERTRSSVMLVILAGGVSAPIVWMTVGGWTRRLDRLVKASERIAGGDLSVSLNDERHDEIARLAQTYDTMRTAIAERDARMRDFTDTLQQQVEERTHDLEAAKLLAENASSAKTDFLANMSHEIRTPMTAILGYIDLLGDESSAAEERAFQLATMRRNARHLLALINDILDVSKIEAGELTIEHIESDPVAIIVDIVSLIRPGAHEKGLSLTLDFETPIPRSIMTDPMRLRQILMNLTSNAVKFTEKGSVLIAVSCDRAGNRLLVRVEDTGVGLTAEQITRLFKPFMQADESVTRRFGGTGLGLAIAKRLAGALGGDIVVESKQGAGSVFTLSVSIGSLKNVSFRTPTESMMLEEQAAQANTSEQVEAISIEGARVLLVEDGVDNQRLIAFLLRKAGCEVDIEENGLRGVEAATLARDEGRPYDVMLLDMQMPVMDGYTAATRLRAEGYTGLIVALTAHAMRHDREKCLDAGCDDYVAKPIDRDHLFSLLNRLISERRQEIE